MPRKATNFIIIHCAATTPAMTHVDINWIRNIHVNQNKWSRVGYHYFIKRDGIIQAGCPQEEPGIHAVGYNWQSVAVCMAGGIDAKGKPENNFTPEQWVSLEEVIRDLHGDYPEAKIIGHRDTSPDLDGDGKIEKHEWMKACPSFEVSEWLKGIEL